MSTPPFGAQSMVAPLRRVLVKRPEDDFAVADSAAKRTPWPGSPPGLHPADRRGLAKTDRLVDAFVEMVLTCEQAQ